MYLPGTHSWEATGGYDGMNDGANWERQDVGYSKQ